MRHLPVTRVTAFLLCTVILGTVAWVSGPVSVSAQRHNNNYIMRASSTPIALIGAFFLALFAFLFRSKNRPLSYTLRVPLWRRFISLIIDTVIALAIAVPFDVFLILVVESLYTGKFTWQFERQGGREYDFTVGIFATILTMGWFLFYLSYPIAKGRPTIGHFIMGYRIANKRSALPLTTALWHNILGFLVLCVWIVAVPLAAFDSKKQLFHESDDGFFPELLKYK